MHLAFIRPSMSGQVSRDALQPLVFALIKALTPADIELTFIDGMIGPVPLDLDVDAVALTVGTFSARTAYSIADAYRARGVPVIMGGFHPTACPDEASEHADSVVIGEAEDTWPNILADLRAGVLKARYASSNAADPATWTPDWSAIDRRRYPPLGLVQFSRGCRYACEFCSIHAFYGAHIRTRPLPDVIAEIGSRPERYLFFVDDNLFADRGRARELFRALIGLGKRWVCQISMDAARDPALLSLMRQAGCLMVLMGFESLDVVNLKAMGKGANLPGDYDEVLANIRAAGLMIYGTFVIGYDHDTAATAARLRAFAEQHRFAIANFNPLMPMPDTRLHQRLARDGRLLSERWWLDPDVRYGDALLTPASMSPADLTSGCRDARFGFYSVGSMVRRLGNPVNRRTVDHLAVYVLGNVVSAKEIHAKQGRRLGTA